MVNEAGRIRLMRWVGWFRSHEKANWRRACEAESLDACAKLLDKATQGLRIKSINQIMTGGGYPVVGTRRKEKAK
jgi:hypothetical protein